VVRSVHRSARCGRLHGILGPHWWVPRGTVCVLFPAFRGVRPIPQRREAGEMMEGSGSSINSIEQEREMIEALLSFAKYAIQNAEAHLTTVDLIEAVELLQQVERLIESRLIELSPQAEPGLIQPEANEMDLRDL